jgi:Mg/Co/Ni transporter MgtE
MLIDLNARLTGYLERGEPTPLRSALSKLDLEEISRLFDEIDAYDAAAVLRLMPTRRRRACLEACSMETRRLIALVFPRLTGSQKQ